MSEKRFVYRSLWHNAGFLRLSTDLQMALVCALVHTDDWGRGRTGIMLVHGRVGAATLEDSQDDLEATGIIKFFGPLREYYFFPRFFQFQDVRRPLRSTVPLPSDENYLSACREVAERAQRERELGRHRKRRERASGLPDQEDDEDILRPDPTRAPTPLPGTLPDAPLDLPPRLRDDWAEIRRNHGPTVAARALAAAKRLFGVPSSKQLLATFQAAHDVGATDKPAEQWPDFRERIESERLGAIGNPGAGGTDPERRKKYDNIGKRVLS